MSNHHAHANRSAVANSIEIKAALIALGLLNALFAGRALDAVLADTPARVPLPTRVRLSALLSLMIWISVAACGRLIAYF